MSPSSKTKVVIICGPTASGKTSLAFQLAGKLPRANILSVDSRQVYKDLCIITGKDVPKNLPKKISVYGQGIFHPEESANLADFVHYSQKIIQSSLESRTPLVIVGGTGLYLKALTQNLTDISVPPNQTLRRSLEKFSLEKLQNRLKKEDPDKLQSLNRSDLMNRRRLVRYLEIAESKTKPSSSLAPPKNISFCWIGLLPDKKELKNNIKKRVLSRLKEGAINEVRRLVKNFPDKNLPIYTSLGVSLILDFLNKKISKKTLIEKWTNAEVDYARRQTVWFKKQPGIVWYDKGIDKQGLLKNLLKIYLINDKKTARHH